MPEQADSRSCAAAARGVKGLRTAALIGLFILIALLVRTFEFRSVFPPSTGGRLLPFGTDGFYHLRRVRMTVANFPRVLPFFDYYIAFPIGGVCIWAPLFDLAIAALAMLIGFGHPAERLIGYVAAFFPSAIGALTIIPIYFIGKHLFGKRCGLIAAGLFAVLPASISVSMLGRVDHHVADVFMSSWFLLLMLKALDVRAAYAPIAGAMLGLTYLTWHGSNIFVAIVVFYFVVYAVAGREEVGSLAGVLLPVLCVALIFLLPYLRYSMWVDETIVGDAPLENPPQPYMGLSRFHVFFVFLAILLVCWGWLVRRTIGGRLRKGAYVLCFLLPPSVAFLALYLSGYLEGVKALLIYAGQKDPWLSTVAECQPLFRGVAGADTSYAEVCFGYGIYLFPVAFVLMLLRARKEEWRWRGLALFLIWGAVMSCLVLLKRRFVGEFGVCFAVGIGYLADVTAGNIAAMREVRRGTRRAAWTGLACVSVLTAMPAVSYFFPISERHRRVAPRFQTVPDCYREAIEFLRDKTPPTGYYYEPTRKPEYGVLAEWKCGEWIQCLGRRPVTANCMGTHLGRLRPFRDSARFLFVEDEGEAVGILERNEVRFVMTAYFVKNLVNYHRIAGVELSRYAERRVEGGRLILKPLARYFLTMGSRLHEYDGRGFRNPVSGEFVAPLQRFRLIYEGARDEEVRRLLDIPCVKIFEFVKGARLRGRARRGMKVTASVEVATNRGRIFRYAVSTRVADDGSFELIVPYSTKGCPYRTRAVTPYAVYCDGATALVDVAEGDLAGGVVECDLTGGGR